MGSNPMKTVSCTINFIEVNYGSVWLKQLRHLNTLTDRVKKLYIYICIFNFFFTYHKQEPWDLEKKMKEKRGKETEAKADSTKMTKQCLQQGI